MLTSCSTNEHSTANVDPVISQQTSAEPGSSELREYKPIFSNDVLFVYDDQSNITIDGFSRLSTLTDFHLCYPMTAIHKNEGEYYTVYSLESGGLAYVMFRYSPNTGVDFYLSGIVEYPFTSSEQEQKLWFLLPQDRPEVIIAKGVVNSIVHSMK